ncbi:hypothetical protein [Prolixibacter sp. NT017]|uniref:hypothetical protein n=1 Tax=Prolixibacter sp. NT017 TaxID=2652390 RepID=UPI001287A296|nr:hypothetical protein [Prolixibacter sp. NT017]GET24559.1 hypothetical protein NT017_08880 [Prolixibacter sp. NT017]
MMKNLLFLVLVFGFYSASAQISFRTGNSQLDLDLNVINAHASADFGTFKADMNVSYNVAEKKIDYMRGSLHMAPGEIYLALEISKIARVPLDNVISAYRTNKSRGWGYIARQVGIKPGSAEFHQLKNNAGSKKGNGAGKKPSHAKMKNKDRGNSSKHKKH